MHEVDFEAALITSILDQKDIRTVIRHKIKPDFFFTPTGKAEFTYLIRWYKNPSYGDVPSWESFMSAFPGFTPVRIEESIVAVCDKVREQKVYSDIATVLQDVGNKTTGDPLGGFLLLKQATANMVSAHTVDESCDIRDKLAELRLEYYSMKSGSTSLKGLPYPWEALNEATLGLQDSQLVFFYSRPKVGKTWLLLEIARVIREMGHKVLLFSQELSDIEIARRFVCLSTHVDYDQFLRGHLPPAAEAEFFDNLDAFVEHPPIIVDMLGSLGEEAILEMTAKIDELRPRVVLIDGFHTLGRDWKELAPFTKSTKRLAKTKHIPIVATTHRNRMQGTGKKAQATEEGADDFAHADAFYQYCDLAVRLTADIENKRAREIIAYTAAVREGKTAMWVVNAKYAEDLSQKAVRKVGDDDVDSTISDDNAQMDGEADVRVA